MLPLSESFLRCVARCSLVGHWSRQLLFPGFVLTVYAENVTHGMDLDAPLTETVFTGTLAHAVAWLIPYGDPPLFIVGLPSMSSPYLELSKPAL